MNTTLERPLRVALYNGIVLERDAVSMSFLRKLRLLQRLRDEGLPFEITGFTQGSDFDDPDIRIHPHIGSLVRDPCFNAADVHVFEYAMWYDLFDALLLVGHPSLVIDHNTTPPELVDDPVVREACVKANLVRHNLHLATRIVTVGEYTRDQLVAMGLAGDLIDVIHLPPVSFSPGPRVPPGHSASRVDLLYVGRFVAAKGIDDLLEAMEHVWAKDPDVHLTMAGSIRFSQPEVVAAVDDALVRHRDRLHVVRDGGDEVIAELYRRADVFVMPSHHEGYCVPIIEAMSSGCYVIGSDAGNVPNVMGGLGTVFPTADVRRLARVIADVSAQLRTALAQGGELVLPTSGGEMPEGEWLRAVERHLQDYSATRFEQRFLEVLGKVVSQAAPTASGAVGAAS
jgi:glycosyltransferase involved in cell wall biosynthesis